MDDGRAKFGLRDCATDDEAGSENESDSLEEFSDSEDSYEEAGAGKRKDKLVRETAQIARELSWGARDDGDVATGGDVQEVHEEPSGNVVKDFGTLRILEKPRMDEREVSEGDDGGLGFRVGVGGLRADSMDGGGVQEGPSVVGMVRRRRRTESWADMTDGDDEEEDGIINRWASRDGLVDQDSENEDGEVRRVKAEVNLKGGEPYNVPTSGTFYLHDDRWEEQPTRGRYHRAYALWYRLNAR